MGMEVDGDERGMEGIWGLAQETRWCAVKCVEHVHIPSSRCALPRSRTHAKIDLVFKQNGHILYCQRVIDEALIVFVVAFAAADEERLKAVEEKALNDVDAVERVRNIVGRCGVSGRVERR
jgi:hypothetical protein